METGAPPPRAAPIPPGLATGIEDAVAQLRAALEKDPSGVASDESTRLILERLNAEIARMADEEGDGAEGGEGDEYGEDEYDDEYDDAEGEDAGDGAGGAGGLGASARSGLSASGRVRSRKGPLPVELWRAAHETGDGPKEAPKLTVSQWNGLVERLNDSSTRKQAFLMRAQHAQIASELAGLTFTPHISGKSRELAAHNKSLPQRMEALMRKKKAKLEKIRHDRVQKEMAEATFKPDLEKSRASVKTTGLAGAAAVRERRQIGHLLQYELDKRIRAAQRRQFIAEMEDRELTFNPAINPNSARIVDRLNREREERAKAAALTAAATGAGVDAPVVESPATTRAAKKALTAALAAGVPLETAAAVTGVPLPDPKLLKSLGRSYLPGHEEETFHPRINPRSAALFRPGLDDKDVYSRLYTLSTTARNNKTRSKSPPRAGPRPFTAAGTIGRSPAAGRPATASARGYDDVGDGASSGGSKEFSRDAAGFPVDDAGDPAPGHPHYFNVLPYDPLSAAAGGTLGATTTGVAGTAGGGRLDFLLRRLLPSAGGGGGGGR